MPPEGKNETMAPLGLGGFEKSIVTFDGVWDCCNTDIDDLARTCQKKIALDRCTPSKRLLSDLPQFLQDACIARMQTPVFQSGVYFGETAYRQG
jgi:hypothetical protein